MACCTAFIYIYIQYVFYEVIMDWTRGENSASLYFILESVPEDGIVARTLGQEQKMAEVNSTGMYA